MLFAYFLACHPYTFLHFQCLKKNTFKRTWNSFSKCGVINFYYCDDNNANCLVTILSCFVHKTVVSFGHMKCVISNMKYIPVSLVPLVVNIAMVTETWDLFHVSIMFILHCSLRDNGLTAPGVEVLARTLQQNKHLEELK